MITSRNNPHLKTMRRLRRSKGEDALLEGPHLIAEAQAAGLVLSSLLATPEFLGSEAGRRLEGRLALRPLATAPRLLEELADSDSPRGVVAVARLPRPDVGGLPLVGGGVYVYAEGIQDPGNLGALARVAEASGAAGLCLSRGSAHPNGPRALRASAGSLLRLPVTFAESAAALKRRLAPLEPTWASFLSHGGQDLFATAFEGCLVLALGSEGGGLSAAARAAADLELTIPLAPPVESLNVATAAAVALFELRRRKRG